MPIETIPLTRSFEARIDDVSTPRRTVTAKINTNCVDRYNTVIVPRGGNWSAFMRSGPAVLWEHGNDPNRGRLPVAHCSSLKYRKLDDDILGVMQFKGDDFSSQLLEHYATGTLRSFSVEFLPDKAQTSRPTSEEVRANPEWGSAHTIYRAWELTGFSAVAYPGNPEALAVAVERGLWVPEEVRQALSEVKKCNDDKTMKVVYGNDEDEDEDEDGEEDYDRSKLKKVGDEWGVYSDEGELIAKHKTKAEAVQQLKAIYVHKEKEKKKSAPFSVIKLSTIHEIIRSEVLRAMAESGGQQGGYTTKVKQKAIEKPGDEPDDEEPDEDEDDEEMDRYISHEDGQYVVHAEDGKVLGKHKTKADAVKQLQAIEANKHKKSEPLPIVATFTVNDLNNRITEAILPMAEQLINACRERNARDLNDFARGRV